MRLIARLITVIFSGISVAVLYALMLVLVSVEFVMSKIMAVLDGLFEFVEHHLRDQIKEFRVALHGEEDGE